MSCCAPGAELGLPQNLTAEEVLLASPAIGDGLRRTDLAIPDMHCGACLQKIEGALGRVDGVEQALANLSARRVSILWRGDVPPPMIAVLEAIGYPAHLSDGGVSGEDPVLSGLLRSLAVAGFAASNIMLLSVSIWSGAEPATRDLFHWISALIALPALAYSGQVFFRSAWVALRHGQTNMDVPISIGVLLAFGMSLHETIQRGPHAYFDAAVSLLFFLLIGRTLDRLMRTRALQTVQGLARLSARGALVLQPNGTRTYLPVDDIEPGMTLLLAAGERIPVDARVTQGRSELDRSLVSGESAPQSAAEGTQLQAGILNLTGPLEIVATARAKDSFLAEILRMMEAAEAGRSTYRRIADRAARLYAPVVHTTAFVTFVAWMIFSGDLHRAIMIAIAVLIITCPCALALAVPMVHVVAAKRLFDERIVIKDGSALERLATVDAVIFDKTGTLTTGRPRLVSHSDPDTNSLAATIATHSRHPYAEAFAGLHTSDCKISFDTVSEYPGMGLEAALGADVYRFGRPDWAVTERRSDAADDEVPVVLSVNGTCMARFHLDDILRSSASEAIADLTALGIDVSILSGDTDKRVRSIAMQCGLPYTSGARPDDKVRQIATQKAAGKKILMVGDGLNDAPALLAADVSMAPASAADIGRNAADFVFLRDSLSAVPQALSVARKASARVRQNFALAIAYNIVAIPIAVLGHVTPLLAAVAMSLSSTAVVANALRPYPGQAARRCGTDIGRASPPASPVRGAAV